MGSIMMYSKESWKRAIKKLCPSLLIILLIPLLPALMETLYAVYLIPSAPLSIKFQLLIRLIIYGSPIVLLIGYGYIAGNKVVSTVAGMFLIHLQNIYTNIFLELLDPSFIMLSPSRWLEIEMNLMVIHGLIGYLASQRTKAYLLVSIILSILYLILISGID